MGKDWLKLSFVVPNTGFSLGMNETPFLKYQHWEFKGFISKDWENIGTKFQYFPELKNILTY